MKIRQLLIGVLLVCSAGQVSGQVIGFDKVDESAVLPWVADTASAYSYVYRFGESETESSLVIFLNGDTVYAQIRESVWDQETQEWYSSYKNLTNVRIQDNRFYSDQTEGVFVFYGRQKGLKVYRPWSGLTEEGEYEIGLQARPVKAYFDGDYIQASLRALSSNELLNMSRQELKIMRNEIFARYGYRFRPSGAMDRYFRTQEWYRAVYEDVNAFLTDLERSNIARILKAEKQ